jgi:RNA processing factor Prp31
LKSNNQHDAEIDDRLLSLLLKKKVERPSKNIQEHVDQNQLSEIVDFDENIPPTNMSFLDRLFHQLTRPSAPTIDDLNEDISTETVETTTINANLKIDENNSFMNTIRLFIDDLNKETNVIRGVASQDACLNQRSPNKKSSFSSMDDNRITSF